MNILVTGASGFIGRHLTSHLRASGHHVETLTSTIAPLLRTEFLDRLLPMKFDRIYHMATLTRAGDFCAKHGADQWITNQYLNTHIVDWWYRHQRDALFIGIGTSTSYAEGFELKEENYLSGDPIPTYHSYAMGKRMLFTGLQAMNRQYGMNFVYIVPSTVYGTDYHADGRQLHFIYDIALKIIRSKRHGSPVKLIGDCNQVRELVHVSDFLKGLDAAVERGHNQILNLGSGQGITIAHFANLLCEIVGLDKSMLQFGSPGPIGMKSKVLEIAKMREVCGFTPSLDLKTGLTELVRWCEDFEDRSASRS